MTFKQKETDGMTFRMQQQLQEFDFNVVHRAGVKHGNADGLSRMLEEGPTGCQGRRRKHSDPAHSPFPSRRPYRKQVNTEWRLSQWSVIKPTTEGKWGLEM